MAAQDGADDCQGVWTRTPKRLATMWWWWWHRRPRPTTAEEEWWSGVSIDVTMEVNQATMEKYRRTHPREVRVAAQAQPEAGDCKGVVR